MTYSLPKITGPVVNPLVPPTKKVNWGTSTIPTTISTSPTMGDITGRVDAINRATAEPPKLPTSGDVNTALQTPAVQGAIGETNRQIISTNRQNLTNTAAPTGGTAYDLARQDVDAWRRAEETRRQEAIRRQLGAQNLGGGIERGETRTAMANIGQEAGSRMTGITQAELLAQERAAEAEKGREWATGERESGQDWQSSENALGRDMAMKLEEGRASQFYAQLKQSGNIAEAAQELQKYGIDQSTAYNFAALDQARYFAQQGLDLQASAQALQERGLNQQDAQYYAGLAQTERMFGTSLIADVFKAALVPFMERINVNSPEYQQFIDDMGTMFNLPALPQRPPRESEHERSGLLGLL